LNIAGPFYMPVGTPPPRQLAAVAEIIDLDLLPVLLVGGDELLVQVVLLVDVVAPVIVEGNAQADVIGVGRRL
jgi:hypothetical protein